MNTYTGLKNDMGQSVALKSVHLDGRLDGLLLSMRIRQRYFNDSDETIEASYTFGWKSFDQACQEDFEQNLISEETALLYCSKRGPTSRGIDNIKKKRGEVTSNVASLGMRKDAPAPGTPAAAPPPLTLKLK